MPEKLQFQLPRLDNTMFMMKRTLVLLLAITVVTVEAEENCLVQNTAHGSSNEIRVVSYVARKWVEEVQDMGKGGKTSKISVYKCYEHNPITCRTLPGFFRGGGF